VARKRRPSGCCQGATYLEGPHFERPFFVDRRGFNVRSFPQCGVSKGSGFRRDARWKRFEGGAPYGNFFRRGTFLWW